MKSTDKILSCMNLEKALTKTKNDEGKHNQVKFPPETKFHRNQKKSLTSNFFKRKSTREKNSKREASTTLKIQEVNSDQEDNSYVENNSNLTIYLY